MQQSRLIIPALVAALLPLASGVHAQTVLVGPANGLKFNLTNTSTTGNGPAAFQAFQSAALRWSSLFSDNITINLSVGLGAFSNGNIIGSTSPNGLLPSYASVRTALTTDARSANDLTAVANLAAGTGSPELINRTSDNPNGSGSATAYQTSAGTILVTTANAKALGLYPANNTGNDGTITFNQAYNFDFNEADGVNGGQIDFLFVATHEIGHAMGFLSGVDSLDTGPGGAANTYFKTTLDLFRYSAASRAGGSGITDFTAGTSAKYFSIDGGATGTGVTFSTGQVSGDGSQASHWKDNSSLGIMDPTAANGETGFITQNDIRAFDVMGYNLAAAPEPSQVAALGLGLLGLGALALRARRKLSAGASPQAA